MNWAEGFSLRHCATVLAGVCASLLCASTFAGSAQAASSSIFGTTGLLPRNIQIDSKGNLYIANFGPNISTGLFNLSKITPGGVSTPEWAQTGAAPNMIVFDSQDNIYTVNELSYSVSKITQGGVSNVMWGLTDETIPGSLTIDSKGNIYTGNYFGSNVSKITPSGVSTKNWAPAGKNPDAITVDADDNIYVTNQGSDNISKITPDGKSTVNWGPGGAEVKTGDKPYMFVFDSAGNLYSVNYTSQNVSKITPDGTSTVNWGPGGAEVKTTGIKPITITIDSAGNLYTGDHGSNIVTKITPAGVATTFTTTGDAPRGITIDSAGNLYTANQDSKDVSKITPTVTNGTPDIFPAPPAKPSAPTATAGSLGSGAARVSVTANPTSAAFGTPTSYTITATQDASKKCVVTSPTTSCTVTGLTVGTAYTFTSRANLNSWQTAASAPSKSVTPVGFVVVPTGATSSVLESTIIVRGPGTETQRATFNGSSAARSARTLTACTGSKKLTEAGRYKLNCNLTSAARSARQRGSIRVTLTTTFTPTGGVASTVTRTVTLKKSGSGGTGVTG